MRQPLTRRAQNLISPCYLLTGMMLILMWQTSVVYGNTLIRSGRGQLDYSLAEKLMKTPPKEILQRIGNYNWTVDLSGRAIILDPDGKHAYLHQGESLAKVKLSDGLVIKRYPFKSHARGNISPDGSSIVGHMSNTVFRLDLKTGKMLTNTGHKSNIQFSSLSPDGKYLLTYTSYSGGRQIKIWNTTDLSLHQTSPDIFKSRRSRNLTSAAWSKKEPFLYFSAIVQDKKNKTRVWKYDFKANKISELKGFQIPDKITKSNPPVRNTRPQILGLYLVRNESQLVTVDNTGNVLRYDTKSGEFLSTLLLSASYLGNNRVSADGKKLVLTMFSQRNFARQNIANAKFLKPGEKAPLPEAGKPYKLEGFLNAMVVLDLEADDDASAVKHIIPHRMGQATLSNDAKELFYVENGVPKARRITLSPEFKMNAETSGTFLAVKQLSDQSVIVVDLKGRIQRWQMKEGKFQLSASSTASGLQNMYLRPVLATTPDEKYLLVSNSTMGISLYDLATLKHLNELRHPLLSGLSMIKPHVGQENRFTAHARIHLIQLLIKDKKLKLLETKQLDQVGYTRMSLSIPDKNQALIIRQNDLVLLNTEDGSVSRNITPRNLETGALPGHLRNTMNASLFPALPWVALLYHDTVRVMDYNNGRIITEIKLKTNNNDGQRRSPRSLYSTVKAIDANHLLLGNSLGRWDMIHLETGKIAHSGQGHINAIRQFLLLPDKRMMVLSFDSTTTVWQLNMKDEDTRLTDEAFLEMWNQFEDPQIQFKAQIYLLKMSHEHLPALKRLLEPATLDEKKTMSVIAMLDSPDAKNREEARSQLMSLGEMVVPLLEQSAQSAESLELHNACLEMATDINNNAVIHPHIQRQLLVISALKSIEHPDAKAILKSISTGHPASSLTKAAIKALSKEEE